MDEGVSMAAELEHIKKMLQHNWDGPMWYGGNLSEMLKGISAPQAYNKPVGLAHNIYEYVCHMYTWRRFVVEFINGNTNYCVEIDSEKDWPTQYEATEENWSSALKDLAYIQAQLLADIDKITNEQLNELVPGKKFRWYAFLHGIIHHDIYHSGQINLLKKL